MFVTDRGADVHCVYKFQLPKFQLITKVGKEGTGVKEFNHPGYLTLTTDRSLLIPDRNNDRIAVMDTHLNHKGFITHQTMTCPIDVKECNKIIYVLSDEDNPCLHVFSQTGEKIRSLITRDFKIDAQVRRCYSFCLDKKQNILMSDKGAENIKVFSQEGALLHTLGDTPDRDKAIKPYGITLTFTHRIFCTSYDTIFGLHIF